jgi:hypothetical protein
MEMNMSLNNVRTFPALMPHNETSLVVSSSVWSVEHTGALARCRHHKKSPQATEVLK